MHRSFYLVTTCAPQFPFPPILPRCENAIAFVDETAASEPAIWAETSWLSARWTATHFSTLRYTCLFLVARLHMLITRFRSLVLFVIVDPKHQQGGSD